jgi:hypothetical protein
VRLFGEDLHRQCPYRTDQRTLLVAYYASAEVGCHLALGWPMPSNVLDLFVEYRVLTNSTTGGPPATLLAAMAACGLAAIETQDKEAMRALAMRGGPYSCEERHALLEYCASDVDALSRAQSSRRLQHGASSPVCR